jgi:hypothetical protein
MSACRSQNRSDLDPDCYVCPNDPMPSDFSALDAELDTLGAGAVVDALSIASGYAGALAVLSDFDASLDELEQSSRELGVQVVAQPSAPSVPTFVAPPSGERFRAPQSEEIVLPDPMPRDVAGDQSGELSLDHGTPRSGSFALDGGGILPGSRDDTIETTDEELSDADVDLIDLRSESAPMLGNVPQSLFDVHAASNAEAQEEADAAFAALFDEATRQSNMPQPDSARPPSADTAVYDEAGRDFAKNFEESAALAETLAAEELDSAEFEIVMDEDDEENIVTASSAPPPHPSRHPSQAPEKRPSFLGRLFGRKEE